jgi:hypothetical protein
MNEEILTEEEIQLLILALADGRGDKGVTEEDRQLVLNWAVQIRIGGIVLDLILHGTEEPITHAVLDIVPRANSLMEAVTVAVHDASHQITVNKRKTHA